MAYSVANTKLVFAKDSAMQARGKFPGQIESRPGRNMLKKCVKAPLSLQAPGSRALPAGFFSI
jgi:hypothetical protein